MLKDLHGNLPGPGQLGKYFEYFRRRRHNQRIDPLSLGSELPERQEREQKRHAVKSP